MSTETTSRDFTSVISKEALSLDTVKIKTAFEGWQKTFSTTNIDTPHAMATLEDETTLLLEAIKKRLLDKLDKNLVVEPRPEIIAEFSKMMFSIIKLMGEKTKHEPYIHLTAAEVFEEINKTKILNADEYNSLRRKMNAYVARTKFQQDLQTIKPAATEEFAAPAISAEDRINALLKDASPEYLAKMEAYNASKTADHTDTTTQESEFKTLHKAVGKIKTALTSKLDLPSLNEVLTKIKTTYAELLALKKQLPESSTLWKNITDAAEDLKTAIGNAKNHAFHRQEKNTAESDEGARLVLLPEVLEELKQTTHVLSEKSKEVEHGCKGSVREKLSAALETLSDGIDRAEKKINLRLTKAATFLVDAVTTIRDAAGAEKISVDLVKKLDNLFQAVEQTPALAHSLAKEITNKTLPNLKQQFFDGVHKLKKTTLAEMDSGVAERPEVKSSSIRA